MTNSERRIRKWVIESSEFTATMRTHMTAARTGAFHAFCVWDPEI